MSAKSIAGEFIRPSLKPNCYVYHKADNSVKELRETLIAIKIIKKCNMLPSSRLEPLMAENNELIAIFVASIATTAKNMNEEKKEIEKY